jgi:hypothetical protein
MAGDHLACTDGLRQGRRFFSVEIACYISIRLAAIDRKKRHVDLVVG